MPVGPGDVLVFYTDGITEARNPSGELFGDDRLRELLAGCARLSAEECASQVLQAARQFAAGSLGDDVALLVLRVPALGVSSQR